jgi:hypothetical protein
MKIKGIGFSETLTTTYKTTRSHNPEDHNQYFHNRENIKSHIGVCLFNEPRFEWAVGNKRKKYICIYVI